MQSVFILSIEFPNQKEVLLGRFNSLKKRRRAAMRVKNSGMVKGSRLKYDVLSIESDLNVA